MGNGGPSELGLAVGWKNSPVRTPTIQAGRNKYRRRKSWNEFCVVGLQPEASMWILRPEILRSLASQRQWAHLMSTLFPKYRFSTERKQAHQGHGRFPGLGQENNKTAWSQEATKCSKNDENMWKGCTAEPWWGSQNQGELERPNKQRWQEVIIHWNKFTSPY